MTFDDIWMVALSKNYVKNHQTLVKFREKRSELMSRLFVNDREILSYIKFKPLGLYHDISFQISCKSL